MKQTIILTHIDGETTEMDLNIGDNPIEDIELTVAWDPEDEIEFELDDRTIN